MCLLIEEIDCVSRFDFSCGVFFFLMDTYWLIVTQGIHLLDLLSPWLEMFSPCDFQQESFKVPIIITEIFKRQSFLIS